MARRTLLFAVALVFLLALAACNGFFVPREDEPGNPTTRFVYVSNFTDNATNTRGTISQFLMNADTGALTSIGTAVQAGVGPAWLTISNGRFLYAANDAGGVSAYTIGSNGALTAIGNEIAAGLNPVAVAATTEFLFVANNVSEDLSVFSINQTTGALTAVGATFQLADAPVALRVHPTRNVVYVALSGSGIDALTYSSAGAITRVRTVPPVSAGAEDVALDAGGNFLYAPDGASGVAAYRVLASGDLQAIANTAYPAGTTPIAATVDPTGKFLYVANRGSNNVSAYTILNGGSLAAASGSPFTAGGRPVALRVEPSGRFLFVANFDGSPDVSIFAIDAGTSTPGKLTNAGSATSGPDPSYIAIR